MTDRFVVTSVGGMRDVPTAYYVNDTVYLYRVIAAFEPTRGVTNLASRARAERLRDTLNQWAETA